MSRKPPQPFDAPFGFAVLYRRGRSGKWRELGRAATMLEALAFVEGRGAFWIHALDASATPQDADGDASHAEDLEADSAGDTGHETESGNGRDGGNHGIRPAGKKLMPVDA